MSIVERPNGREIFVCANEFYVFRIFEIPRGTRTSLHYHTIKTETLYIDKGSARYWLRRRGGEMTESILREGDIVEHYPFDVHRQEALEDLRLLEVSTPPLDDIVRIEDDYGRENKGPLPGPPGETWGPVRQGS